nr:Lrp/AsnC family transcriptional regulator [Caulobacter sp. 17J80-11]
MRPAAWKRTTPVSLVNASRRPAIWRRGRETARRFDVILDDKDRQLIAALTHDAREPLVALARRVGLSRSATQGRLARLERAGVIEGYTVRLAPGAETAGVSAVLSVTLEPGRTCAQVLPALSGAPEIVSARSLAGPIDLLLEVACASPEALSAVRERVAATPGVAAATTHLVLTTHWRRAG